MIFKFFRSYDIETSRLEQKPWTKFLRKHKKNSKNIRPQTHKKGQKAPRARNYSKNSKGELYESILRKHKNTQKIHDLKLTRRVKKPHARGITLRRALPVMCVYSFQTPHRSVDFAIQPAKQKVCVLM